MTLSEQSTLAATVAALERPIVKVQASYPANATTPTIDSGTIVLPVSRPRNAMSHERDRGIPKFNSMTNFWPSSCVWRGGWS